MSDIPNILIGIFLFVSLYFEVFLLLTFLEHKSSIKIATKTDSNDLPTATVIVPCFNEQKSVLATIQSLLALDYPRDKLKIMIVDDGSTDNTWNIVQQFQGHPMIDIYHKENGGKHTALNFAITRSTSDIIGCLDADSFVDSDALRKIAEFFNDKKIMAVVPSIRVFEPKSILEKIQEVQYTWGIFMRKTLSFISALYVTPGPFSFFRQEVFRAIGPYRHAHNTEDCEMALRMQSHHLKIVNCHNAYIYTVAPKKLKALYKQQLRWVYGTLKNIIDYRHLLIRKGYGDLGFLILPVVFISAISALLATGFFLVRSSLNLGNTFNNWRSINFDLVWPKFNFSWFMIQTDFHLFIGIITLLIVVVIILIGRKLSGENKSSPLDLIYFFIIYPIIAPFWLFKAFYNIIISKKTSWR